MVGEALLWTLEKGLKDAFTSEVRDAWVVAYSWLAFTMQRAAARHADAGPQTGAVCSTVSRVGTRHMLIVTARAPARTNPWRRLPLRTSSEVKLQSPPNREGAVRC